MSLADAFAPVEDRYREQVKQATWGHLAPKEDVTYTGKFIFAIGCFGSDSLNPTVTFSQFENLGDSPWFFERLQEFLEELRVEAEVEKRSFRPGQIYLWEGTFTNYEFDGKLVELQLYRTDDGEILEWVSPNEEVEIKTNG